MEFTPLKSGASVEGDEIKSFRSTLKGDDYVYLIGGTHGDEVEGVYVLQKLFDWLKETEEVETPLIVLPILNVDGYRAGTRVNAHGVDLNRNYPTTSWSPDFKEDKYNPGAGPLSEPENVYLDKIFQKYPPRIIISFHSWKPLVNYNGKCLDVAEFISRHNDYEIADDVGYPTPGSLGTYGPEKYQSPVITFECPLLSDDKSLKDIWAENQSAFENLLKSGILHQSFK